MQLNSLPSIRNKSSGSDPVSADSALSALPILHQRPQHDIDAQEVSVGDFCKIKAIDQTGVHLYYLPSVEAKLRSDQEEGETREISAGSEDLRNYLTKEFHIPLWFWEKQGWDANGFFRSKENAIAGLSPHGTSHCSFSRFLVKEVEHQEAPKPPIYHWRYLAFSTLWFRKKQGEEATLILLCFDLIEKTIPPMESLHKVFERHFSKLDGKELLPCPYSVYTPLIEDIVSQYNRAGWTFRKPVRTVEKVSGYFAPRMQGASSWKNVAMLTLLQTNEPREPDPLPLVRRTTNLAMSNHGDNQPLPYESYEDIEKDRNKKVQSYRHMHELSRHIIHASETLNVAIRTVTDIIRASNSCSGLCCLTKDGKSTAGNSELTARLQSQASFLQNLNERTDAFYKRIQNEITLAFHLVDAEDTSYTRQILEATRHDGRELTSVVSVLSILFLPPTFTAGFFGMNFPFGFGSMKPIWIWVVATAVLWIAAFLTLFQQRRRRHKALEISLNKRRKTMQFSNA